MSYFHSPLAEYRAMRIAQLLEPEIHLFAKRDGRVLLNNNGHVLLFTLDEDENLALVDRADLKRPNPAQQQAEIEIQ